MDKIDRSGVIFNSLHVGDFVCVHGTELWSRQYFNSFSREEVIHDRDLICRRAGISVGRLVLAEQVHGDGIALIRKKEAGRGVFKKDYIPQCDALIILEKGVFLGVRTADCVPIVFCDPVKKITAVAHCGWKGTLKRLVQKVLLCFQEQGSHLDEVQVSLGPCIGSCCYDVSGDPERVKRFVDEFGKDAVEFLKHKVYLKLAQINKAQCLETGIREDHVDLSSNFCTCCSLFPRFPSYYRTRYLEKEEANRAILTIAGFKR